MAMNKFLVKDNGVLKDTIDFNEIVLTGLDVGTHEITIEGYMDDSFVTSSSRQIEVTSSTLDPDYEAVINYAIANDIPLPTSEQQQKDNDLIIALRESGRWVKEDMFFNFSGTSASSFKLICWKRRIKATAYGSPTWSEDGVSGNGFNAYINTHFNASTANNFKPNNAAIYTYLNNKPVESSAVTGVYTDSSTNYILYMPQTGTNSGNFAIGGQAERSYTGYDVGLNALGKYGDSQGRLFFPNTTQNDFFLGLGTIPSAEVYILARNNGGNADLYSTFSMKYFGLGGDISPDFATLKTILV